MKNLMPILFVVLSLCVAAQSPDDRLKELGITLPEVPASAANYVNVVRSGNLLFLSGKGPKQADGSYMTGKLGNPVTIEQGYAAARLTAIIQLAVLKQELGSLANVKRIVKVNGYVNSDPGFYDQPKVINGFSDVMTAVFGNKGKHARTALGVNTLPFNMMVEVELVVEVNE